MPSTPTSLGKNLVFSSDDPPEFDNGAPGALDIIDLWLEEGNYWSYGTFNGNESCTAIDGCAHFTQVKLIDYVSYLFITN